MIPSSQRSRVFLIAVALPVLLTAVNTAISERLSVDKSTAFVVVAFSVYIAEMAVIAVAAGAAIRQTWLAWTLFAWLLQLINLSLIVAMVGPSGAGSEENGLSSAAVTAAQSGFLVVWAVLGSAKWYQRLPIMLVIACVVLYCWYYFADLLGTDQWTMILIIELASIALLSIVLRFAGFRLRRLDDRSDSSVLTPMQFGLRHVLVLITALAILLGVARAAQILTLPFFLDVVRSVKLWRVVIACPSAMLVVIAFWAALGKGSAWLRIAIIALGCLTIGFGMAEWSMYALKAAKTAAGRGVFFGADIWQCRQFLEVGYWWIAWYCLSTGLLAACLLFFRTRGYRIIRTRRIRSSA